MISYADQALCPGGSQAQKAVNYIVGKEDTEGHGIEEGQE